MCGRVWFWYWCNEPDDWWLMRDLLKEVCEKASIGQEFIADSLGPGLWVRELVM